MKTSMKGWIPGCAGAAITFLGLVVLNLMRAPRVQAPDGDSDQKTHRLKLDPLAGREASLFRRHGVLSGSAIPANRREFVELMQAKKGRLNDLSAARLEQLFEVILNAKTADEVAAAIVAFHRWGPIADLHLDVFKPLYVRAAFSSDAIVRDGARSALEQLDPRWDSFVSAEPPEQTSDGRPSRYVRH